MWHVSDLYVMLDLTAYFNNDGISCDADRTDGDFTGLGNTYPEEDLPASNSVLVCDGVVFRFPDKKDGLNNNICLEGQCIPVPEDRYDGLCLLGASSGFSVEDSVRFRLADGRCENEFLGLSSWRLCHSLKYGERVAIKCSGYHFPSQHVYTDRIDVDYGIWMQVIPIRSLGLVTYIEFPDNPDLHIFSITMRRVPVFESDVNDLLDDAT